MREPVRYTRSLCPVCLKNLPAELVRDDDGKIYIKRCCPEHGEFEALIWKGLFDFDSWTRGASQLDDGCAVHCPDNCGICSEHGIGTCCALLEVTNRCNLHCRFCFAKGGENSEDPSIEELKESIDIISEKCGGPLIQFSGGEPTVRDDLPELIRYAKTVGCSYTQVNTNGIRIAEDPDFAGQLAASGLDIVFLKFDGVNDDIYTNLRGRKLLETKLRAIDVCGQLRLGVTLVPTVVPGVNDGDLGNIIRFATENLSVKGIHFQPVSYFGRHSGIPDNIERYTLDALMKDISMQADIPISSFMPSRCDHPLCGFHASFIKTASNKLRAVSSFNASSPVPGNEKMNREYVAKHWIQSPKEPEPEGGLSDDMDFDSFLYCMKHRNLTLSAMAFQDATNINIERLHRCSLHVYDNGKIKPFCAKYISPITT